MPVARQIDCLFGDGVASPVALEALESLGQFLDFCETNSLCTRIAFQNGSGGSGATWAFTNAGDNAFAVYRFDAGIGEDFYILIQATDSNNFGTSPGDPGLLDNSAANSGLAIQMAVRADGLSPWNGTTLNNGSDSKGDPVWVGGDDPPFVFPMSNNAAPTSTTLADYDHVTSKENCAEITGVSGGSNFHRAHFYANEECLFVMVDNQNNGNYVDETCCGRYLPANHMAADCTLPYFMIRSVSGNSGVFELGPAASAPPFNEYGSRTGTATGEGGAIGRPADGVTRVQCHILNSGATSATFQPNALYPTPRIEIFPFTLQQYEPYPINRFGHLGYMPVELMGYCDEVANYETNAAVTIAAIGATPLTTAKMGVSWDGGAAPSPAGNTTGGPLGRQSFTA